MKRELRPYIRIFKGNRDRATIEIDFNALHVRMLYHKMRIDFKSDPYGVLCGNNYKMRKYYKHMLLMAINASNEEEAIKAFRKKISEDGSYKRTFGKLTDARIGQLIQDIKRHHPELQHFLFSGKGNKLMFEDSWIANKVLLHFAQQGKLCLCVHDSFIVLREDENELREVMQSFYGMRMGFKGTVDLKK